MQRIALGLEYDGSYFHGWQRQNDLPTVQLEVEHAISRITQSEVKVICAGRTDAGVHGLGQVIHFDSPVERPLTAWIKGVNTHLPKSIRIQWAKEVQADFHARFSAISRRYLYFIHSDPVSPGLMGQGVTWVYYDLDVESMQTAANHWIGKHDFSAFRARDCQSKSPIRHIYGFSVKKVDNLIVLNVQANAFLKHMIRNMVGTLLVVGKGQQDPSFAKEILLTRERSKAPGTAPPFGLYFFNASYPDKYCLPSEANLPWYLQHISL